MSSKRSDKHSSELCLDCGGYIPKKSDKISKKKHRTEKTRLSKDTDDSKSTGVVKQELPKLKPKDYKHVFNLIQAKDRSLHEIGRGGNGIVYVLTTEKDPEPKVVFKVSLSSETCNTWGKEIEIIQVAWHNFYRQPKIKTLQPLYSRLVVFLGGLSGFESPQSTGGFDKSACIFGMERINGWVGAERETPRLSIQAMFGEADTDKIDPKRGYLWGYKKLMVHMGISSTSGLLPYVTDIGKMIALIHYAFQNDAYDIELLLNYEPSTKRFEFVFVDMDQTLPVPGKVFETPGEEKKKAIQLDTFVDRFAWSLDAMPYFPDPDDDVFYPAFKAGYLNTAKTLAKVLGSKGANIVNVATQVLEAYEG